MKLDYNQLWKNINSNNLKKFYYGIPSNVRSHDRFIKNKLGTKELIHVPDRLLRHFDTVYQVDIKIYQPVSNIMFFHDKFTDIYEFFDVSDKYNPKAVLVISGMEMEQLGDNFDKFLKHIKRNKLVI